MRIQLMWLDILSRVWTGSPVDSSCTQTWSASRLRRRSCLRHPTPPRWLEPPLVQPLAQALAPSSLPTSVDRPTVWAIANAERCLRTWRSAMRPARAEARTQKPHALTTLTDSREWLAVSEDNSLHSSSLKNINTTLLISCCVTSTLARMMHQFGSMKFPQYLSAKTITTSDVFKTTNTLLS